MIRFCFLYCTIFNVSLLSSLSAQIKGTDLDKLRSLVETYKTDERGPYKDIRWFCPDGTFNDPKVPCNQEGSIQRARYKDEVVSLGSKYKIYLGQILSGTDFSDMWDVNNFHDRVKQYELEQYLKTIDDGWINRKAQFYRGSIQIEDEMKWGKDFLTKILSEDRNLAREYFMVRQTVAAIPHEEDDRLKQKARAVSKNISDEDARFMKMRIKIHGNPDKTDRAMVDALLASTNDLNPAIKTQVEELSELLVQLYAPVDISKKLASVNKLPDSVKAKDRIREALKRLMESELTYPTLVVTCDALIDLRGSIVSAKSPALRLTLIDLSIDLENMLINRLSELKISTLGDLTSHICNLSGVVYSMGYLEDWEWSYLEGQLSTSQSDEFGLYDLIDFHQNAKNAIEWGANMVRVHYNPTINKIGLFEPLAFGLIDDKVRSGPLLYLGKIVSDLGDWLNADLKYSNQIIGISQSNQIRGLNAGYAKGILQVVTGDVEDLNIDKSKIYIFDIPPSDLKPIAGIATVSEGNPVSHIQLLARNLGIPNAVISLDDFKKLEKFKDQEVFYAVCPKGTVILKKATDMTADEKQLFTTASRPDEKVRVPTDKLKLEEHTILNLRNLDKDDSGIYCGPKAANLGELKRIFPERVVEGLVIPFGIFKQHMDQQIPDSEGTYWSFVNETFIQAKEMTNQGAQEDEIEKYQIGRLAELQELIKNISLLPEFEKSLGENFINVLGSELGKTPVFLRSDTNMEDLKDFTGAGLNLTLFNVLDAKAIVQGIKDVWASPYSERSFKWRQKFLLNPESVYPSILIIPSVDVDYSGVLITKGLKSNDHRDLTVAFNRGVGGAVDGQAAESYTLAHEGFNYLNAPSREIKMRYMPVTGGTKEKYTDFSTPILNKNNLEQIRILGYDAYQKIKFSHDNQELIAHDIELGFLDDQMWLFQVRPFVENKNALSSEYLNKISPETPRNKLINYNSSIQ